MHIHPEQVANGSLKALLLKELEKTENEHVVQSAKISIARQDFVRSYKCMASTHLNRKIDGPKKRARVLTPIIQIYDKINWRLCTRLDMSILLQ